MLVIGGKSSSACREAARDYGFKRVVISEDILAAHPTGPNSDRHSSVWPFREITKSIFVESRPLPTKEDGVTPMPIDAIFVFNDPRDWGMHIQIMLDFLIPPALNDDFLAGATTTTAREPPPALFFSNPDLLWASDHPTPRLGQGAFRSALAGVYSSVITTTRPELNPKLKFTQIGKPFRETYHYAEATLLNNLTHSDVNPYKEPRERKRPISRVYMVGDNPLSDIRGANNYRSDRGIDWVSVLVESGVYRPGQEFPADGRPRKLVKDAFEGVLWALEMEGYRMPGEEWQHKPGWREMGMG